MPSVKPLKKVTEEQSARIYELYQKKSRSFRNAFYGVSGLAVIFFGLVFYPYVSRLGEKSGIARSLNTLDREISNTSGVELEYGQIVQDLVRHQHEVERQASELGWSDLETAALQQDESLKELRVRLRDDPEAAAWALEAQARPELSQRFFLRHPHLRDSKNDPCFWLGGEDWLHCELAKRVGEVHEFAADPLRYRRISHVRNDLLVPLGIQLDDLEKAFREWLFGRSPGWEEGRASEASKPQRELNAFWHAYFSRFEERHRFIVEERSDLKAELSELEKKQAELMKEQAKVDQLLEEIQGLRKIETPIGELPVGLDELVLIFPVLLAAGFLSCGSLFSESLRLRRVFHQLTRAMDPAQEVLTDEHVALVAPLWVDPLDSRWGRTVKLVILALPAVVFVLAISLLLIHRLLLGNFPEMARLPPPVYVVLYLLSCGLIFEGFRRIGRELRRYKEIA
jgi:hypothetical protein